MIEAVRPYLIAGGRGRAPGATKKPFQTMPHESEDARITGTTRSLQRRLLGLNLRGSKLATQLPLGEFRIA